MGDLRDGRVAARGGKTRSEARQGSKPGPGVKVKMYVRRTVAFFMIRWGGWGRRATRRAGRRRITRRQTPGVHYAYVGVQDFVSSVSSTASTYTYLNYDALGRPGGGTQATVEPDCICLSFGGVDAGRAGEGDDVSLRARGDNEF